MVRKWNTVENNADLILGVDTEYACRLTQSSFPTLHQIMLDLSQGKSHIYYTKTLA